MDFKEGGVWFYSMVSPEGDKSWCKVEYKKIVPKESFTCDDTFCDVRGNINPELPRMHWQVNFKPVSKGTAVNILLTFDSEDDLNKILEMGFAEGFTAENGNLDNLLKAQA